MRLKLAIHFKFEPYMHEMTGYDISAELNRAADEKNYFLLRDIYTAHSGNLSRKEGLYWETVFNNLFGREYRSLVAAGRFLSEYGPRDESAGEMIYLTAVNQLRRSRYSAAAASLRKLLRYHRDGMDAEELEEARSNFEVCRALRRVGPQTVELNGIRRIPTCRTRFGHITVGVRAGGLQGRFIVDTGANYSTVALGAAREMGLLPAGSGVEVGTATGVRLDCGLAHAPTLDLSGITVRNAVFIVMEDSQLSFPELDYSIEGIIGLPVLRQLGNLRFARDHIRIGNIRIPGDINLNFCLEGLTPLVEVGSRDERLMFTLDTGANQSEYSHGYYTRHSERLDASASESSGLRGGGGGVVRHRPLALRSEHLTVGGRQLIVPSMNVIREDYDFSRGKDGNLGLDMLMAGDGFAISFDRMAVFPYSR